MSSRARRVVALIGALALIFLATRYGLVRALVRFQAPHIVRTPAAKLDDDLVRAVDTQIDEADVASIDGLIHLSLGVANARLHFGLDHKTALEFGREEREGNCVEYAHLFAALFNREAHRKGVAARAYVVRSDARVFGKKLPWRGFADHDWVFVVPVDPRAPRFFVDPTLYDYGLDWDISHSVSGDVRPL